MEAAAIRRESSACSAGGLCAVYMLPPQLHPTEQTGSLKPPPSRDGADEYISDKAADARLTAQPSSDL